MRFVIVLVNEHGDDDDNDDDKLIFIISIPISNYLLLFLYRYLSICHERSMFSLVFKHQP